MATINPIGSSRLDLSSFDIKKIFKGGALSFVSAFISLLVLTIGNFDFGIYTNLITSVITLLVFFLSKFGIDTTKYFQDGYGWSVSGSQKFSLTKEEFWKYIKCVVITSLGYVISILPTLLTGVDLGALYPFVQAFSSTVSNAIYKYTADTRTHYGINQTIKTS